MLKIRWTDHVINKEVLSLNGNEIDTYTQNQKEISEMSRARNEEKGLAEFHIT